MSGHLKIRSAHLTSPNLTKSTNITHGPIPACMYLESFFIRVLSPFYFYFFYVIINIISFIFLRYSLEMKNE
jgi:hypothetical protein